MIELKRGRYYLVDLNKPKLKMIIKITDKSTVGFGYKIICEIEGKDSVTRWFSKDSNFHNKFIKREITKEEVFMEMI